MLTAENIRAAVEHCGADHFASYRDWNAVYVFACRWQIPGLRSGSSAALKLAVERWEGCLPVAWLTRGERGATIRTHDGDVELVRFTQPGFRDSLVDEVFARLLDGYRVARVVAKDDQVDAELAMEEKPIGGYDDQRVLQVVVMPMSRYVLPDDRGGG